MKICSDDFAVASPDLSRLKKIFSLFCADLTPTTLLRGRDVAEESGFWVGFDEAVDLFGVRVNLCDGACPRLRQRRQIG